METHPYTVQGLTEALSALGTTPGAVADTLLAAGHRGQLGRCSGCPVAVYLAATFPAATKTFVTGPDDGAAVARLYLDGTYDAGTWRVGATWTGGAEAVLPDPVAEFVARFDAGHLPELEADVDLDGRVAA